MRGASAMGVPGWPDLACWTASIESVRMQLIDSWSNCELVIGPSECTAGLAIALILTPPIFRWRRAVRPLRDRPISKLGPGVRATLESIDRHRACARAFQP